MEPTLSDIELLSPLCDFNNGILRNPDETSHDRHDQVSISSTLDVSKTVSIQATQLLNCSPLACQDTSIVLPELEDDGTRPSFSFSALIAMALVSSPERKLSLRDICAWIRDKFTYYRDNESNWSNSIRHNLSLNKAFIKIAKPKEKTGKGHYWTVDPAYVNSLFSATTGSVTRGRTNRKPRKPASSVSNSGHHLPHKPSSEQRNHASKQVKHSISTTPDSKVKPSCINKSHSKKRKHSDTENTAVPEVENESPKRRKSALLQPANSTSGMDTPREHGHNLSPHDSIDESRREPPVLSDITNYLHSLGVPESNPFSCLASHTSSTSCDVYDQPNYATTSLDSCIPILPSLNVFEALPHCTSTVTSTSTTSSSSIPSSYHSDHVPTPAEILEQAASSASTESPGPTIQSLPSSPYSRTVLPTDYPGEQGSMRENSWNASSTPPVLDETVCLEDGVPQTLNTVRSPDGLSRDYHRNLSLSSSEYLPVSSESPNTALRIHREKVRATLCPSDLYRSPQTPDPWIPQVSQTHLAAVTESSSVKPQSLFQAIVNATCFGSPDMLEARRVAERRSLICGLYAHELREDDNSLLGKVDAFAVDLVGIVTRETYRARLLQSSPKSAKPDLNVYF